MTDELRWYAQNGGQVLWLAETPESQQAHLGALSIAQRHGRSWQGDWASSMSWIRQDKIFGGIPTGGTVDFAFADLTPETVIVGLNPTGFCRQRPFGSVCGLGHHIVALVAERPVDRGRLMICTYRLREHLGAHPVATIMMHDMIRRMTGAGASEPARAAHLAGVPPRADQVTITSTFPRAGSYGPAGRDCTLVAICARRSASAYSSQSTRLSLPLASRCSSQRPLWCQWLGSSQSGRSMMGYTQSPSTPTPASRAFATSCDTSLIQRPRPDPKWLVATHDDRTPIPVVHVREQRAERKPTRVTRAVLPSKPPVGMLPLVRVVVIDPDDIEISRVPAQLRLHGSGEHIPGFELCRVLIRRRPGQVGPVFRRQHANQRLGVHDASGRVDRPDRFDTGDGGPDQLMLERGTNVFAVRMEVGFFSGSPSEGRDLIDRRVELYALAVVCDESRCLTTVSGKPIHEPGGQDVEIIRPAVVTECPDHLNTVAPSGLQHRPEGREIESSRGLTRCQRTPSRTV